MGGLAIGNEEGSISSRLSFLLWMGNLGIMICVYWDDDNQLVWGMVLLRFSVYALADYFQHPELYIPESVRSSFSIRTCAISLRALLLIIVSGLVHLYTLYAMNIFFGYSS